MERISSNEALTTIQIDALRIILKRTNSFDIRENSSGLTSVHLALRNASVLRHFLEGIQTSNLLSGKIQRLGVSFNVLDRNDRSPLWYALELSRFDSAALLIEHGADVNEKRIDGVPILIFAMHQKRDDITRFLLDNGADATAK